MVHHRNMERKPQSCRRRDQKRPKICLIVKARDCAVPLDEGRRGRRKSTIIIRRGVCQPLIEIKDFSSRLKYQLPIKGITRQEIGREVLQTVEYITVIDTTRGELRGGKVVTGFSSFCRNQHDQIQRKNKKIIAAMAEWSKALVLSCFAY